MAPQLSNKIGKNSKHIEQEGKTGFGKCLQISFWVFHFKKYETFAKKI
jgi:hypothetical protein